MKQTLLKLQTDYPDLSFKPSKTARWDPESNTIFYAQPLTEKEIWSLCHEIGHALSGHKAFNSDIDLLLKELEAWEEAKKIASRYNLKIDESYMERCMDTYRDWVYKRSTCPKCHLKGIQRDITLYICINCQAKWTVSSNQASRPYRIQVNKK